MTLWSIYKRVGIVGYIWFIAGAMGPRYAPEWIVIATPAVVVLTLPWLAYWIWESVRRAGKKGTDSYAAPLFLVLFLIMLGYLVEQWQLISQHLQILLTQ